MENTSPFLFDNVDEKYFLAVRGKAVGPLTAHEVHERIEKGEVGLLHYVWREGLTDWKRVCDEREFAILIPQKPTTASIGHIKSRLEGRKAAEPSSPDSKNHYIYFNRSQYGPFSKTELEHVIKTGKVSANAYLWIPGWPNWRRLSELAEWAAHFPPPPPSSRVAREEPSVRILGKKTKKGGKARKSGEDTLTSEKSIGARVKTSAGEDASEKRGGPRRPLVARLFLHNDKDVIIAVCRDISVGGMQVLTDRVPGPVGTMIKLNVSPGDPSRVKGFVAEGEIVRVLEDGRGFSFRFRKITDEARRTIESYIRGEF
jgi:hypothetical protein